MGMIPVSGGLGPFLTDGFVLWGGLVVVVITYNYLVVLVRNPLQLGKFHPPATLQEHG
jgi:hypothetical protein